MKFYNSFLTFCLLLNVLSAAAFTPNADSTKARKRFSKMVQVGGIFGFGQTTIFNTIFYNDGREREHLKISSRQIGNSFSVNMLFSKAVSNKFYAGFGFGIEPPHFIYKNGSFRLMLPLFADFKYVITDKKIAPYLNGQFGYHSFLTYNKNSNAGIKKFWYQPGNFLHYIAGARFVLKNNKSIFLGGGYRTEFFYSRYKKDAADFRFEHQFTNSPPVYGSLVSKRRSTSISHTFTVSTTILF